MRRSRAALAGLTSVLFVGGVAALAEHDPANRVSHPSTTLAVDPATLTPPTTVVVERVARTIYLDRNGNLVAPPPGSIRPRAGSGAAGLPAGPAAPSPPAPPRPDRPATPGSRCEPDRAVADPQGAPPRRPPARPRRRRAPAYADATQPPTTPLPPPPTVPPCTGSKCP